MLDNSASENCHCKEEVEIEEAQALVAALERSSLAQDALPYVPGLSREPSEASVTVYIQDEVRQTIASVASSAYHTPGGHYNTILSFRF